LCEVGETRVENRALAWEAIGVNPAGRVVMPGFVDSHPHLLFTLAPNGEPQTLKARKAFRSIANSQMAAKARFHLARRPQKGMRAGPAPETKILRVLAELQGKPADVPPTKSGRTAASLTLHGGSLGRQRRLDGTGV
jgi:hypothetical protein